MSQITAESYNRQMGVASRIHAAAGAPLPADRKELQAMLVAAEQAAVDHRQFTADIADLEAQIEQATSDHQTQAHRLQRQLVESRDAEQRLQLRQELQVLNEALQRKCNDLNGQIATAQSQADDLFVVSTTANPIRTRLAETADKSILASLTVAENSVRWATARMKEASKRSAELESMVEPEPATTKWGKAPTSRYSDKDLAALTYQLEVARLELTTAAAILSEAQSEVALLKSKQLNS